ncbi:hypothetical protein OIDMADRAFT_57071 [Oidiodendron maius Zn]|uniref:Enoyl reductase (ER) domain-containing protein n=1 Tax=Oidiodendron maius (strain Zn) TaxID=913774 RepID=A0A0C3D9V9_OIDMZ|nr:hypothetical protein OIDMADRAFT_57071 [Oidiodendron maius Zn]
MGTIDMSIKGFGCEAAGIIRKVGLAVTDFKVGDRIISFDNGMLATRNQVSAQLCAKIPELVSYKDGAKLLAVYGTVIHSLLDLCNIQKGQTVLIHSAAGGIGIAAIHLCRMVGAEVYTTAGNEDKRRFLQETFKIQREKIFHSRNTSFLPDITRATNNRGVDVVLNSLAGGLLHAGWQCEAEFGKSVERGKRDFRDHGRLDMDIFGGNRSFFNLLPLLRQAPSLRRIITVFAGTYEGPIDLNDVPARKISPLALRGHESTLITFSIETLAKQAPDVSFIHSFPGSVKSNLVRGGEGPLIYTVSLVIKAISPLVNISSEECGERMRSWQPVQDSQLVRMALSLLEYHWGTGL